MNKPTEQQVREFWEWCGFELKPRYEFQPNSNTPYLDGFLWHTPEGFVDGHLPSIDLNNLFKYAVKWDEIETIQFSHGDDGCHCWIYTKKIVGKPYWGNGETDEDALFWALWQVKES